MIKIVILAVLVLLSFVAGTIGLYMAMPSIAPDVVDHTRVKLDSLGLISIPEPSTPPDRISAAIPDSAQADSSAVPDSGLPGADSLVAPSGDILGQLSDSLRASGNLAHNLQQDNSALAAQIDELKKRIDKQESKKLEASELSKSVTKLEDNQLGDLLAGLELDVIETLYLQSSARDRTRLLQNMAADRAAVFVRSLVKGPLPAREVAATATDPENQAGPSNQ